MAVKAIPEGFHSLTPGCVVEGAAKAMEFYKKVFHAEETVRMPGPNGTIMHAEMRIGDSIFMLGDGGPQMPPYAMNVMLYVTDVDTVYKRAVDAGCKVEAALADMFWGDRAGRVVDPFGNTWFIATHKEDLTPEETQKRADALFGSK